MDEVTFRSSILNEWRQVTDSDIFMDISKCHVSDLINVICLLISYIVCVEQITEFVVVHGSWRKLLSVFVPTPACCSSLKRNNRWSSVTKGPV